MYSHWDDWRELNLKTEATARETLCPYGVSADGCIASKCMAWDWRESGHEFTETDNLTEDAEGNPVPAGEPPRPEGEGWEPYGEPHGKTYHRRAKAKLPRASEQVWRRKVSDPKGLCARLSRD